MHYTWITIQALPLAGVITAVIYWIAYRITRTLREKPARKQMLLEFILTGWFVMFIYVTQAMSFGNGMGERYNLTPLVHLVRAVKYGAVNAGMMTQFLLNILMFIPAGLLLPLVCKQRFRGFLPVLGFSFAATFLTEASQLITGRTADIDDIIANTLGGVLGFSLFVFGYGIFTLAKLRIKGEPFGLKRYPLNLAISAFLVVLTISPIAYVKIRDGRNTLGDVYYGHLQPLRIEILETISDWERSAPVYKNIHTETQAALAARLLEMSGIECTFEPVGSNVQKCSSENNSEVIFIYPDNTWTLLYNYGSGAETNPALVPTETDALSTARSVLEAFHIPSDSMEYAGLNEAYADGGLHIVFTDSTHIENQIVWGTVEITIGESGALLAISDRRTTHEYFMTVDTISPRRAIDIAQDIGVGEWNGTATVTDVEPSYYFNRDTGFLIPTWQIHGSLVSEQGPAYEWMPNINAVK